MNQWFVRLTEQMSLAHDDAAVADVLQKMTSDAGFSYFAYLNLQAETQTAISTYPKEWQVRYFEKKFAHIDPVVLNAKSRPEAFAWSNTVTPGMTKERRAFYGEASEFGIRSGISVPINTGFGRMAMLTLASDEPNAGEGLDFSPVMAAASFGQVHSRMEVMRVRPTRVTRIRMKANELTCLRWCSEGKTARDIADIENTTYGNVRFFIRNAKNALGVTSLAQATALAKELGLI
ncbi:MAG TPA: autoinducer binding domain-containing protein [Shinella sp.]|uniref:autoinducer binding domain-containing protein n=1 Tax=Shinella TaxID=323620 RepID=UPI0009FF5A0A|nr:MULTISPECIES: autoinducer binding domain-containing protein [Shinella]MDC7260317.1 autoinducer binding domain-containing protein [Shinella sp. YE25]CAI0341863.1 Transcriptional activator protein TraR [Rhizobiaceae bacterium]CAK7262323.1 Transcriptional activator protein TraR [Shinella sp. WSC3-e]HEV7248097.1 autoinducer binding domain-containing protein [Shinella sp.]